jgi:hypothetical protein
MWASNECPAVNASELVMRNALETHIYISSWYSRSRCTKAGRVPSSTVMLRVLVFGKSG